MTKAWLGKVVGAILLICILGYLTYSHSGTVMPVFSRACQQNCPDIPLNNVRAPQDLSQFNKCPDSLGHRNTSQIEAVMAKLVGPDVKADDPALVAAIAKYFIDIPRPYITKLSMPLKQTPQAETVDKILKGKRGGFFVECGALDGERSSNSIWLEQKRGWTGLLVEMDPSYYLQVRGKNRNSYSINACLSPKTHPIKMTFKEHQMGEGKLIEGGAASAKTAPGLIHNTYCFPLLSLMLALNRTHIDYFSLDVEGMEVPILKTVPFQTLDISVLTVEYNHGKDGAASYTDLMKNNGYKVHSRLNFVQPELYLGGNDYVFVKDT